MRSLNGEERRGDQYRAFLFSDLLFAINRIQRCVEKGCVNIQMACFVFQQSRAERAAKVLSHEQKESVFEHLLALSAVAVLCCP